MILWPGTREPAGQREGFMSEWHRTRPGKQSPYAFSRWIKSATEPLGRLEEAPLQTVIFSKIFTSRVFGKNSKGLLFIQRVLDDP